jgi:hypothetical protein
MLSCPKPGGTLIRTPQKHGIRRKSATRPNRHFSRSAQRELIPIRIAQPLTRFLTRVGQVPVDGLIGSNPGLRIERACPSQQQGSQDDGDQRWAHGQSAGTRRTRNRVVHRALFQTQTTLRKPDLSQRSTQPRILPPRAAQGARQRPRASSRPLPASARICPFSKTTSPRRIVIVGQPVTSCPE